MRDTIQFEFSINNIEIDDKLSYSFVTKTFKQKEIICELFRYFASVDNGVLLRFGDNIFEMFSTMRSSKKCYFFRVNDSVEKCKKTINDFDEWCMNKTNPDEEISSRLYYFTTGSDGLTMTVTSSILDTILSMNVIDPTELKIVHHLSIDESKVLHNDIEVSMILCFKDL